MSDHDLETMRYRVISTSPTTGERRVVAAFEREGHVAAFFDSMEIGWRQSVHLEDRDGILIENVRYREPWPGYYGHAMAIAERIAQSKRDEHAGRGFHYVDTGRRP